MSDQLVIETGEGRTASFFGWINGHVKWITIGVVVLTVVALPLAASRSQDDPNFDPSGEIYDILDLVGDQFQNSSPVTNALFIVEARQGRDALTHDVLWEFKQNSDALRSNGELSPNLAVQFRSDLGEEIDGVFSLADKVADALPGGLETATDADVKIALADILGEGAVGSPLRDTLSQLATSRSAEINGQQIVLDAGMRLNYFDTSIVKPVVESADG